MDARALSSFQELGMATWLVVGGGGMNAYWVLANGRFRSNIMTAASS